jgi:glycosyltransferase involved in cell wall biosynthesis
MKEKLIYVLPQYDPMTGTHFCHLYELLQELAYSFDIFLIVEKGKNPDFTGFKEIYLLCNQNSKSIKRALEILWVILRARLAGYRRIYTHYSMYGGVLGSLVMRMTGGYSYYWSCGLMGVYKRPLAFSRSFLSHKLGSELPLWLVLQLVNTFVTGTGTVGQHYVESYGVSPGKIQIMPNWVNLRRFDPDKYDRFESQRKIGLSGSESEKVILFVHRITESRGADRILPLAVKILKETRAVFVIVGDGPYLGDLKANVHRQGLDNQVLTLGSVPNVELPHYYRASDLLIMPSREEGFPRVLIEAMAMGVPFVAAGVGGVQDITTDLQRRFTVYPYDSDSFAANVLGILQDDVVYRQLAVEGQVKVREYELKRIAARFKQIVSEG